MKPEDRTYHYFLKYMQCPRKFYLSWVLNLEADFKNPGLLRGSILHDALTVFYKTGSLDEALLALRTVHATSQEQYEDKDLWSADQTLLTLLLKRYVEVFQRDFKRFEILAVEQVFLVAPPSLEPFQYAIKPDLVIQDRSTRLIHIINHKFTSWDPAKVWESLNLDDQPTAHLAGWNVLHPGERAESFIPGFLYSPRNGKIDVTLGEDIYRTRDEQNSFLIGLSSWSDKIASSLQSDPRYGFPRRGDCDSGSFFTCPYRLICRSSHLADATPPVGFHAKVEMEVAE